MANTEITAIRAYLEGLPPADPSPDLWDRLSAAIDAES